MQVEIGFGGGVAGERQGGGVTGDAGVAFDDNGGVLLDGVCQVGTTIESMNASGERVAGIEIRRLCRPGGAAGDIAIAEVSLDARERFADIEAEAGVKGERAIVVSGLDEAHSRGAALVGAIHDGAHEFATDAGILRGGIDGEGADARDDGTLVEAIASDDASFGFGDDAIEAGMREQHGEYADGEVWRGEIGRKIVAGAEFAEGVVTDLTADGTVSRSSEANYNLGLRTRRHGRTSIFPGESITALGAKRGRDEMGSLRWLCGSLDVPCL